MTDIQVLAVGLNCLAAGFCLMCGVRCALDQEWRDAMVDAALVALNVGCIAVQMAVAR